MIKRTIFVVLALLLTLSIWSEGVLAAPSEQDANCDFFTETVAGEGGFFVCDDENARFLSAFESWGLQKIGYPISRRYSRDGFVTQAFQKAIMQWRADTGRVALVNIFDDLHNQEFDESLLVTRQVPTQLPPGWDGELSFEEVVQKRQTLLEVRPALQSAYFAAGDPLTFYGLPTSEVQDMGNHYAIRLQRTVLQEWKEDVPWAKSGDVTIANGGDIAKELGSFSVEALLPESASSEGAEPTLPPAPTVEPEPTAPPAPTVEPQPTSPPAPTVEPPAPAPTATPQSGLRRVPPPPPDLEPQLWQQIHDATITIRQPVEEPLYSGSGIVVGTDGRTFLTAFHVIGDPDTGEHVSRVSVGPFADWRFTADVIATANELDLAVLRVNEPDFPGFAVAPLGRSAELNRSSPIYTLSYPGNLGELKTGKGHYLKRVYTNVHDTDLIMTDAPATFGSSGGVAVNDRGEVIGIISVGIWGREIIEDLGYSGLGQATLLVPIDAAADLLREAGVIME
ncbi:MAG: S1 family peptidase [Ardenticatenaceae bacterium]